MFSVMVLMGHNQRRRNVLATLLGGGTVGRSCCLQVSCFKRDGKSFRCVTSCPSRLSLYPSLSAYKCISHGQYQERNCEFVRQSGTCYIPGQLVI